MAHPIGYYTSYSPLTHEPLILYHLQDRYGGGQLQGMSYEQKIVMRTALSTFISQKPVWQADGNDITLIDLCIEGAGVDWDVWNEDGELVNTIQACPSLEESDIEGLIQALTEQIKDRVYSSRIEEWEVVSP